MQNEAREPDYDTNPTTRQFAMGDHGPFQGQGPKRSDDDIRQDVESALFYDDAVSSIGINVAVNAGNVILSGKASSDLEKRRAGADAWRVVGVTNVENNLAADESPTPSRAAGQDLIDAKPPEPIYGEPPEKKSA
jgi:osmotically-inducible protein OsmY